MTDKHHWLTVISLSLAIGLAATTIVLWDCLKTERNRTDTLLLRGAWYVMETDVRGEEGTK